MSDNAVTIITTIVVSLTSASVFSFIQFMINRSDQKKEKEKTSNDDLMKTLEGIKTDLVDLKKETKRLEKDGLRTQMLEMINDYPDNESEIMTLAEHYFKDLKGNWYATDIFTKWMARNHVTKPEWFD